MKKNLFYFFLTIALVIEASLTFLCFIKPIGAMALFGMSYNNQTAFLAYIIAWFCLLVSVLIIHCIIGLKNNNPNFKAIVYILSCWWIGLGIGVFVVFKKTDNLMLDSLKGLILIILTYLYDKEESKKFKLSNDSKTRF